MGVGKKIKEYRNKLGITQKELADKLYVTYQAVSRWENEETEPSISTLTQICEIFNCTVEDLIGMEKKESSLEEKTEEKTQSDPSKVVVIPVPGFQNQKHQNIEKEKIYKGDNMNNNSNNNNNNNNLFSDKILKNESEKEKEITRRSRRSANERVDEFYTKNEYAIRRTTGLVAGLITAAVILVIGILISLKVHKPAGIGIAFSSILFFTFINSVIYDNNFVALAFEYIKNKGFFGFLGFFFDEPEGFFGVILVIIGLILFLFVAVITIAVFAVLGVVSLFLFPVALYRNIKHIEV